MTPGEISSKYDESFQFLQTRKQRQVQQLILMNNLQRGDQNIASTMLITLFNRVLSNLYDDKMQVKFVPSEELDQKAVNSLNILAQNDYREMDKARLDYDWAWDTLFFGRGYMETLRFDKARKLMEPEVINPLVFGYDPYFSNPQQWRYYWKWITKSKWEIKKLIDDGTITGISDVDEIGSGIDPYLWNYKVQRETARKATPMAADSYSGDVFQILEFFGYNDEGKKCIYWLDRDISKILMEEVLDLNDGEDGESNWPIVIKEAFREPHSSVVFSVADLLDDKHRAKSVLLNLAFMAAKDSANPIYGYNPDKVKDVTQFFSRQISQHIPMDDETAAWPLNTKDPMNPGLVSFLQVLNQEANDPVGTGLAQEPESGQSKSTATEASITQQMNDLAQSLFSKVFQFGEQEFWEDWYQRYKRYSKDGDVKIATIVGVKGMTFEKIDLASFHTSFAPGVMVFSAKEAEYKELVLRRDLMQMYPQFQATLSPDGMRNFNKYVFFPKFLQDPQVIDILIPQTRDEIKANEENDALNQNSMPQVADTDNHEQHLAIHAMGKPTWAKWTHMAWHEELLAQKGAQAGGGGQQGQQQISEAINFKDLPPDGQVQMAAQAGLKISPQAQPQDGATGASGAAKPKVGADQKNPMKAAAPLATAISQNK